MERKESEYKASETVRSIEMIDIKDLEQGAQVVIPSGGWGYIQGGAGDEWTMRQNTESFNHKQIIPRVLADLENPELQTTILGTEIRLPVLMAPVAAHGLAHVSVEAGTARGVAASGTIMGISTYAGMTIEEITKAGGGVPQWFQLYLGKDDGFNRYVLEQAVAGGVKAIVLTVDATVGGNREADMYNHFTFPLKMANLDKYGSGKGQSITEIYAQALQKMAPEHIEKIASYTGLPVIVKGIQAPEDAMIAIGYGTDVIAIGRPAIYGLALGGWKGVKSVFDFFYRELAMVMQLAGTKTIEDIKKEGKFWNKSCN